MLDIVVVGSGVVGCAIARELSKFKLQILVIDKAQDVGDGASKSNSGIIHGGYDELHGTVKSQMCRRGNELFDLLESQLQFGFRRVGSLVVARNDVEKQTLEHLFNNGKLNGVQRLYLINQDEIRCIEPNIHPDIKYALYCPDAGLTSPYEYAIALAQNAAMNGVQFLLAHEVISIKKKSDHFIVNAKSNTQQEAFACKIVINAAGLGSAIVADMVGAKNFEITPRIGKLNYY
jgi:glycerol-3-phosphate dehydrogenase